MTQQYSYLRHTLIIWCRIGDKIGERDVFDGIVLTEVKPCAQLRMCNCGCCMALNTCNSQFVMYNPVAIDYCTIS